MKTIKKLLELKAPPYLMIAGFLFLASCDDKIDFTTSDSANVENEAATDGYFEDSDDMATTAVTADNGTYSGGRVAETRPISKDKLDARFACSTTVVTLEFATDNTLSRPHGTITVNFGTAGCTDSKGNIRKGIIRVEFIGKRFLPESQIITTFDGYEINGVKLEGTRTVTNVSGSTLESPKFSIILTGGKAIWANGSATREVNLTRELKLLLGEWRVTGTASGTNRNEKDYQMTITKTLVYKRECAISSKVFMAVEGTKELIVDGKKITIDYGTGECDRKVNITVNGKSMEVEVKGDI